MHCLSGPQHTGSPPTLGSHRLPATRKPISLHSRQWVRSVPPIHKTPPSGDHKPNSPDIIGGQWRIYRIDLSEDFNQQREFQRGTISRCRFLSGRSQPKPHDAASTIARECRVLIYSAFCHIKHCFSLLKCSLISGAKVYQVPASQSHIWCILGYHPNPVARNRLTSNSVHFLSSTSSGSLWSHPLQTPPSIAYHQFLQLLLLPPDSIPLVFFSHPGFFTHLPFREMSQSTSTIELFSYTSTSLPTSKAKRGGESNSLPHSHSQPIPTTSSCTQSL